MAGKRCKATTKSGQACSGWAIGGGDYCFTHDPSRGEARALARRTGGYNRKAPHGGGDPGAVPGQVRTLADVLAVLDYALRETLALENSIARGRLLVSIAAEFTNAIKTGELETRMQALEAALKARQG